MDLEALPGAADVISWFGYMPSFHDAEVIEIILSRNAQSSVAVHCWNTTNELDDRGDFTQDKHAVVTFRFTGVSDLSLAEFNHQNVISGIEVMDAADGLRLELQPCYGVTGTITAETISLKLSPGKPPKALEISDER